MGVGKFLSDLLLNHHRLTYNHRLALIGETTNLSLFGTWTNIGSSAVDPTVARQRKARSIQHD